MHVITINDQLDSSFILVGLTLYAKERLIKRILKHGGSEIGQRILRLPLTESQTTAEIIL